MFHVLLSRTPNSVPKVVVVGLVIHVFLVPSSVKMNATKHYNALRLSKKNQESITLARHATRWKPGYARVGTDASGLNRAALVYLAFLFHKAIVWGDANGVQQPACVFHHEMEIVVI